jgi:uncharacterized hydantoinase/oxoprolinase family protein
MLCADAETFTDDETRRLAAELHQGQVEVIRSAVEAVIQRLSAPPQTLVLAGSGEFLARQVIAADKRLATARVISLEAELGPEVSAAACAYALAVLAAERRG